MPNDYTNVPTATILHDLIAAYDEMIRRYTERRARAIAELAKLEPANALPR
jgi:hypothetical protein